jgi:hypothetical protein|tara:strand:- start:56 stop:370 length:315 start_codon:yes stop_codon:yes gene_type:complete
VLQKTHNYDDRVVHSSISRGLDFSREDGGGYNALPAPSVTRLIIEEFTQRPPPSGSSPELEKLTMFSLTNAPIQLAPKLTPFAPNGMVIKTPQLFPQHYLKAYK